MSRQRIVFAGACAAALGVALVGLRSIGQDSKTEVKGALPVAAPGDQVIVKREASRVIDPHKYRISLAVEPKSTVTLSAPFDGVVKQAQGKLNGKIGSQTEIVRLDTTVPKLVVVRAEAAYKVALNEQKQAGDKDETQKALAQAKVDVAKADVDLAKHSLESCSIRAPFAGELQRLLVDEGQFVKAGDSVAIVVDVSSVKMEIPVDRSTTVKGKSFSLKIESTEVEGNVEAVLPLNSRFDALRELFDSVASAIVVVDNGTGQFKAGQTVYVPLIPRQPVIEVPASSIANLPDGQRKVQVVRQFTVRDVPVVLMGSVGTKRLFVSGPFAEGDEVIYEASHQLGDAFQLKPAAAATAATGAGNPPPTGAGDAGTTKAKSPF
ncbi:MAG: HlyD family efflux transporter periplasmic adaptor subunit [Candidatus Saccharimonas sp.]|nr:HlyD family efflux transporter periplasmic adaptor subunit [Planctomycetaceae bacterium]